MIEPTVLFKFYGGGIKCPGFSFSKSGHPTLTQIFCVMSVFKQSETEPFFKSISTFGSCNLSNNLFFNV